MFYGKPAVFKGSKEGVVLFINPEATLESFISFLEVLFSQNKLFFLGSSIILDPNGKELTEDDIHRIEEVFKRFAISFTIKGREGIFAKEEIKPPASSDFEKVLVIDHTLRSGQAVTFDGNVVILGNINEGAQVDATLDVHVFGIIKGIVNAGRRVVAFGFQPLRLSINNKIFETDLGDKTYKKPRMIQIEEGEFIVKQLGEVEKRKRGRT